LDLLYRAFAEADLRDDIVVAENVLLQAFQVRDVVLPQRRQVLLEL